MNTIFVVGLLFELLLSGSAVDAPADSVPVTSESEAITAVEKSITIEAESNGILITWSAIQGLSNIASKWCVYIDDEVKHEGNANQLETEGQKSLPGADPGKTYIIKISIEILDDYSEQFPITGYEVTIPPSAVMDLILNRSPIVGSVRLSWKPNPMSIQDTYFVYYHTIYTEPTSWIKAPSTTDTSYTLKDLIPGDRYVFKVYASSNNAWSKEVLLEDAIESAKLESFDVKTHETTETSLSFYYDPPKGIATDYFAEYIPYDESCCWEHIWDEFDFKIYGLKPGTTYRVGVAAYGADMNHPDNPEQIKSNLGPKTEILATTLPSIRSELYFVTEPTETSVTVGYTKSNTTFEYYALEIFLTTKNGFDWVRTVKKDPADMKREVVFAELRSGSMYEIRLLTAVDDHTWSQPIRLTFQTSGSRVSSNEGSSDTPGYVLPVMIILAVILVIAILIILVLICHVIPKLKDQNVHSKPQTFSNLAATCEESPDSGYMHPQNTTNNNRFVLPVPPTPRSKTATAPSQNKPGASGTSTTSVRESGSSVPATPAPHPYLDLIADETNAPKTKDRNVYESLKDNRSERNYDNMEMQMDDEGYVNTAWKQD